MKPCPQCTVLNPEDSIYCQECGHKLVNFGAKLTRSGKRSSSLSKELEAGLGPVFVPPQRSHSLAFMFFGAVVLAITFLAILGSVVGSDDVDRLSSLSNTKVSPSVKSAVPLTNLSLTGIDSEWRGTYPQSVFYVNGTITNNSATSVRNTMLRVDFYWDKDLTDIFDTRYLKITTAISSNNRHSFSHPISGFFPKDNKNFWYLVTVISSEKD
ncbi:MAG: zinc ribbon domain-containing protein [Candidatus Shapirobacteria bacterium]|jgi:hypothetical protein